MKKLVEYKFIRNLSKSTLTTALIPTFIFYLMLAPLAFSVVKAFGVEDGAGWDVLFALIILFFFIVVSSVISAVVNWQIYRDLGYKNYTSMALQGAILLPLFVYLSLYIVDAFPYVIFIVPYLTFLVVINQGKK